MRPFLNSIKKSFSPQKRGKSVKNLAAMLASLPVSVLKMHLDNMGYEEGQRRKAERGLY